MLVLSRRLKEKVLFPSINAAVQVLSIKAGRVRLGIEAPPDVSVVRAELQDGADRSTWLPRVNHSGLAKMRQLNQLLRRRLKIAGIGLAVLARQLNHGLIQDAYVTLDKIQEDLDMLCQRLEAEVLEPREDSPLAGTEKTPRALLVDVDQYERHLLGGLLLHDLSEELEACKA